MDTLRCAIVGPTGFTGLHVARLIAGHPRARLTYLASHRDDLPDLTEEFPRLTGLIDPDVAQCRPVDPGRIADAADVVFLGLPHRAAMAYAPALLDAGLRVVDLSADYRLGDAALYEKTYATPHTDPLNLGHAVYGLPELFRGDLPGARLVATPGCYPTAATLALAPLLSHAVIRPGRVLLHGATGVSGAGRKASDATAFTQVAGAYGPYGVPGGHRHQPEMARVLSRVSGRPASEVTPLFVANLLPTADGIGMTAFADPVDDEVTQDDLIDVLRDAYDAEPFVRVRGADAAMPNVREVVGTNFVDLTARLVRAGDDGPAAVWVFAAIDNLVKGASGQAVQNMNAVFGMEETLGLL
ncbi:N-acetyl-gamma-glutamyl-phosphate reductase [Phycisphaera mikurensis]|uniref:N-acetyl-gamma-glutamyl-phosphate reductase n=1 Tax=Phycisphaera mikurensis (strain NBRC 102666 / KCTC 22515 / FYK2301M01) TaxID=1142394 RepID=I0IID0_PHYMF|nr:N-acetyl-gamma-glutamyl-phosphate reductase [Phycisphaera mikurensis]MBB6442418.1 N-acetyl-gamma-glutamyl-phosphate reductase [Phycisphaera mikurensis]BAM05018.1 N-acetyl-gamma-glutamyl-phosphate reductase [Phycisphaera mikurensis NBRC 102666]